MEDHDPNRDAQVTYRELVAMLEVIRKDLDTRFEAHYNRHDKDFDVHENEHRREADRHSGYMRWLATSIMTGLGVLLAIWAALGRG